MLPEEPEPTTALIVVPLTMVNEAAGVPPKETIVTAPKSVPVIVTVVPVDPVVGVKEVMLAPGGGGVLYVNPPSEAVPLAVVTLMLPDAPEPTTAVMVVEETTVKDVAAVPPKLTAVAPVKFVPVMVTVESVDAVVGLNEVMLGSGTL